MHVCSGYYCWCLNNLINYSCPLDLQSLIFISISMLPFFSRPISQLLSYDLLKMAITTEQQMAALLEYCNIMHYILISAGVSTQCEQLSVLVPYSH